MTDRRPWLIAGCGPSLKKVDGDFRIVTLNRALAFFDRVDIAFLYHSKTINALIETGGMKSKANMAIVPRPLDSYLDWVEGPCIEDPRAMISEAAFLADVWQVVDRQMERFIRCRSFQEFSHCLPPGPCCVGALGWLVHHARIQVIHTVGIDGGTETSPHLEEAYRNRPKHLLGSYDRAAKQFREAVDTWGIRWIKH